MHVTFFFKKKLFAKRIGGNQNKKQKDIQTGKSI